MEAKPWRQADRIQDKNASFNSQLPENLNKHMLNSDGFASPSRSAMAALRKGCSPPGKNEGLTWLLAIMASLRVRDLGLWSVLEAPELFSEVCARGKGTPRDTQPSWAPATARALSGGAASRQQEGRIIWLSRWVRSCENAAGHRWLLAAGGLVPSLHAIRKPLHRSSLEITQSGRELWAGIYVLWLKGQHTTYQGTKKGQVSTRSLAFKLWESQLLTFMVFQLKHCYWILTFVV